MEDDPYGSLIKQCQPTSSQQERLRTCDFAREDEVFQEGDLGSPESNETPMVPTGIVMVSLSDSSKDDRNPPEDFQTPPEESLLASSQEQRTTTAVDALADQQINRVNDSLDGGNRDGTVVLDNRCTDIERMVDLGKDSDNLGFSGVKLKHGIDSGDDVSGVGYSCSFDGDRVNDVSEKELKKYRMRQGELNEGCSLESQLKKLKVTEKNSGLESPNVCLGTETNRKENAGTEVLQSEFEEIGEGLGLGKDTMNVGSPLKETEEDGGLGKADKVSKNGDGQGSVRKNIEDLEKFRYVASGDVNWHGRKNKGVGGRRELPSTISGQAKNVGGELGRDTPSAKHQLLKDLLDALKMVAAELDDGSEDVDFLETAKRRGMTFPRPRWWPPEGFDD